ncbi:S8/S53 family peptidase [Rubrimonas cliftonensis]|uniref:Subtilase family protein n=1 Tax=Rubrimonas cliftonensis TaxID=89524 RepID=A0A1H4DBL1_9RHOB|nr:S8/S53 family peptidase [Rubrimonas cliftonensis]SEA69662.1 Subtilase family protein [Rubrimonas cliftonensis]
MIRDLGPGRGQRRWKAAQALLRAGAAPIVHIDTGLAPHPALGFVGETPPPNIRLDLGINYYDPSRSLAPLAPRADPGSTIEALTEFPDHGVKTLSVILSDQAELRGVAPGAHVVPYRVANGPVFRASARTGLIGDAIDHALGLDPQPRVMSISMGNPGPMGAFELLRALLGGETVTARATRDAIDRAYEAGVIVVCAAGQIIDRVVYPARFARTIAVGGFAKQGAKLIHYPTGGYAEAERVDVWAPAVGVNRAAVRPAGEDDPYVFADTVGAEATEVSGTSYACPQVAAAAALWVAAHADALESAYGAPGDRWRIVEAFRRALRDSATPATAENGAPGGGEAGIRTLDIEALLGQAPDTASQHRKRQPAANAVL